MDKYSYKIIEHINISYYEVCSKQTQSKKLTNLLIIDLYNKFKIFTKL